MNQWNDIKIESLNRVFIFDNKLPDIGLFIKWNKRNTYKIEQKCTEKDTWMFFHIIIN